MFPLLTVQEGLRQRSVPSRWLHLSQKHFKGHLICFISGNEMSPGVQPDTWNPTLEQPVSLCIFPQPGDTTLETWKEGALQSTWPTGRSKLHFHTSFDSRRTVERQQLAPLCLTLPHPTDGRPGQRPYSLDPAEILCMLRLLTPPITAVLLALGLPASWDPGSGPTLGKALFPSLDGSSRVGN